VMEQEKAVIRNKILDSINEDNKQVLLQLALAISKIARSDYPAQWSDLMHNISNVIKSGSEQQRSRAIFILNYVIYELSSKGLEKQQFHEVIFA
jgi:hypothetical protein